MQSKGLSRVFSTPQIKSANLKLLYFMGKETYTRRDELRPSAACDHKPWRRQRGAGSLRFPCWRCRGRSSPVSRRPGKGAASLTLPCAGLRAEPFTHGIFCDPFYTPGGEGSHCPHFTDEDTEAQRSGQPAGKRLSQNSQRRVAPAVPVTVYKAITAELTGSGAHTSQLHLADTAPQQVCLQPGVPLASLQSQEPASRVPGARPPAAAAVPSLKTKAA